MAGDLKYGNTLVSSRKDMTLTFAKFVKGLDGKSVEENLNEIKDVLGNIQGGDHSSAYDDDFLFVKDFALIQSVEGLTGQERYDRIMLLLNIWLAAITFDQNKDTKFIGRCKLRCDGVNIECYNYVCDWGNHIGVQQLMGAVCIDSNNKVRTDTEYNILFRVHRADEWGEWASFSYNQCANTPITNAEIDNLF